MFGLQEDLDKENMPMITTVREDSRQVATKRTASKRIKLWFETVEPEFRLQPFPGPSWMNTGYECKIVQPRKAVIAEKKFKKEPLRERQPCASPPRSLGGYVAAKREQLVSVAGPCEMMVIYEPIEDDDEQHQPMEVVNDGSASEGQADESYRPEPLEIVGCICRGASNYYFEMLWSNGAITMGDAWTCEQIMPGQLKLFSRIEQRARALRFQLTMRQRAWLM